MQPLTRRQAAILSAYTGILFGPFSDFHAYAEEKLGHQVWTHEFASPLAQQGTQGGNL